MRNTTIPMGFEVIHPCCAPSRGPHEAPPARPPAGSQPLPATMRVLSGGTFLMGEDGREANPGDGEGPVREVTVGAFMIDAHAVSNARFAAFARATGYVTDAERFGWSFVFAGHLGADAGPTRALAAAPWWRQVHGADWRRPEGPGSDAGERAEHPVVHVSRHDALAYCAWAGLRLPTEAEWEYAARGGVERALFPWGSELEPGGEHRCNVWQGIFPERDLGADGWRGTAPVDAYPPNGFGLHNTVGNVWEWTADPLHAGAGGPDEPAAMRGGSYLCHASYCNRYRVAARSGATPDSSNGNVGFRCAGDL
jgi:formylglycine-generating enzyme